MFPTKLDLEQSLIILSSLSQLLSNSDKKTLAKQYAKETFIEYDNMSKDEQKEVIQMVLEDIEKDLTNLN